MCEKKRMAIVHLERAVQCVVSAWVSCGHPELTLAIDRLRELAVRIAEMEVQDES